MKKLILILLILFPGFVWLHQVLKGWEYLSYVSPNTEYWNVLISLSFYMIFLFGVHKLYGKKSYRLLIPAIAIIAVWEILSFGFSRPDPTPLKLQHGTYLQVKVHSGGAMASGFSQLVRYQQKWGVFLVKDVIAQYDNIYQIELIKNGEEQYQVRYSEFKGPEQNHYFSKAELMQYPGAAQDSGLE